MRRVLSGIQPTGKLHLGNYLGAIQNWVRLQQNYDAFFSIVDLHAITTLYFNVSNGTQHAQQLNTDVLTNAATLLACGIRPECLFVQSTVPQHAALMWIIGCISPMSWYNKMTQFKDKKEQLAGASLGLYAYPALMAADILLYKGELVPVGDDQTQHLELARDAALRFNSLFTPTFPLPQPVYSKEI